MSRFSGRPSGVVLYEGRSELMKNQSIVLIATFKTDNEKTGNLIQTWILSKNTNPIEAINTGKDKAACGGCPLRGIIMKTADSDYKGLGMHDTINRFRGCYVSVQNAPRSIWNSYQKGFYPKFNTDEHSRWFRGRGLRLGAYGEPVAVPFDAWTNVIELTKGNSQPGYTHQWKNPKFQIWKNYLMASTHSESEYLLAKSMGWRSFRTRKPDDVLLAGEINCPASAEGGYSQTCESCGACDGFNGKVDQVSISTVVHGSSAKISSALKVISVS